MGKGARQGQKRRGRALSLALLAAIGLVLLLTYVSCGRPMKTTSPLPSSGIIDIHCHTAGLGAKGSGCFISEALRDSCKFRVYLSAFGVTEKELLTEGDGLVIRRLSESLAESTLVKGAIVLALDGVVDDTGELDAAHTELYVPNDFVAREVARYDNLYFGASVNPYRKDALERLDQVAAQGARLVKWIPSIQGIDPADPRLIPFYKRLVALNLPLLTHTGDERSFSHSRNELADPVRLTLALEQGVTVIAAHVATTGSNEGIDNVARLLPLFARYPNLYADISSLTQINKLKYLSEILKREDIHSRLVYGTDTPLIRTLLVSPFYFPGRLTLREMIRLARIDNAWDKDVRLKQALGVPTAVFSRPGELLGIGIVPAQHQ